MQPVCGVRPREPYGTPNRTAMPDPSEELITILMAIPATPALPRHRAGCALCWWGGPTRSGGWGGGLGMEW